MILCRSLLLSSLLASSLHAYPGSPDTWGTWLAFTDSAITPRQLTAAAEPDGRLRLAYVDAEMPATVSGETRYAVRWSTFTPFPTGSPAWRFTKHFVQGNPSTADRAAFAEPTAAIMAEPRRMDLAVALRGNAVAARTAWHSVPDGASGTRPRYNDFSSPLFPRRYDSGPAATGAGPADGISEVAVAASPDCSAVLTGYRLGDDLALKLNVETAGVVSFDTFFFEATGVQGWANFRRISSVGCGMNQSESAGPLRQCDIYPLVATTKTSLGVNFVQNKNVELRLFRIACSWNPQTADTLTTTNAQSVLLANYSVAGNGFPGTFDNAVIRYPKILVNSQRSPEWAVWEENQGVIKVATRTGFPAQANHLQSMGSPASLSGGWLGEGTEPDAALDRLDRLHVVWRAGLAPYDLKYARENADGTFHISSLGPIDGAPAIAIGPGDYPYISYPYDGKLWIRYPAGLRDSYHGDFEDRDGDTLPGLVEKAMGQSDTVRATNPAIDLRIPGTNPEISYFLNAGMSRDGTTLRYTMADGNDTIEILPAYTTNYQSWSSFGFTWLGEFSIAGRGRVVSFRDNGTLTSFPRQGYRLHVRRIPGAP